MFAASYNKIYSLDIGYSLMDSSNGFGYSVGTGGTGGSGKINGLDTSNSLYINDPNGTKAHMYWIASPSYLTDEGLRFLISVYSDGRLYAYPYNYVTCSQAQTLASSFASELEGYTSSLMFGVQWNLILKHIETKAVESGTDLETIQAELKTNSITWGNYNNNLWNITNENSKYSTNGTEYTSGAYGAKTANKSVLLSLI